MASGTVAAERERPPDVLGVGTVVWLASELMFFAGLFAAWFSLRGASDAWPPDDVELDVPRTAAATVVLVVSSFTLHAGGRAAEQHDRRGAVRWVLVTVGLGALFLLNQVLEYAGLDFEVSSHAFGSMFYLLTGFHGLHVLGGLGLLLTVLYVGAGGGRAPLEGPLTVATYYWHFVDVVWVAMFATVYLAA